MDSGGAGTGLLVLTGDNIYSGGTAGIESGTLNFNTPASLPSSGLVLIDSGGVLEVDPSGPYLNAAGWIDNAAIDPNSSGTLALTANDASSLDMTPYASLSMGAIGNVAFSRSIATECR